MNLAKRNDQGLHVQLARRLHDMSSFWLILNNNIIVLVQSHEAINEFTYYCGEQRHESKYE